MGCIGLSRSDFFALTPEELDACIGQWLRREENRFRAGWEQARLAGYLALLPYSKRKVREPGDLFRFAWEATPEAPDAIPLSEDEFQEKFEQVANRYG